MLLLQSPVLMQVVHHLEQFDPAPAGGILLGLESKDGVDVTECFPLPPSAVEGDASGVRSKETQAYIQQMTQQFAGLQADNVVQGWYLASSFPLLCEQSILDNMYHLQSDSPDCVLVAVDLALTRSTGNLALRTVRLSEEYLAVRRAGKFRSENLAEHKLGPETIFEEVPVSVINSHLVNLLTLSKGACLPQDTSSLNLGVSNPQLFENGVENILDLVEDFNYDQSNLHYHQRQLAREKQRISQWQSKRKAENQAREAQGQPKLPMDEYKIIFKLPEEPSRLENLLITSQLQTSLAEIEDEAAVASTSLVSLL